jgi:MoxR-like ATPase
MKSPENAGIPDVQLQPETRPESAVSKEKILEGVIFKEIKDKKGKVIGYKSSSPDRKSIELPAGSNVEPGKPYKIRIIEDTKPEDPLSGKLIAEALMEGQPLSTDEWAKAESNVNKAEVLKRKSVALGGKEDVGSMSVSESDKADKKILSELGIEPLNDSDADSIQAEKIAHEEAYEKLLGEGDSPEKALVSLRWKNLSRAMKTEAALERERGRIVEYETGVIKKMIIKQDAGQPVSAERTLLSKAAEKERALDMADEKLKQSSPEAWYGLNLKELKGYKEQLESGKIVETDYVRKQAEEIVTHVRAGQPVFIHGHLGSGKTELAFHVARKYFGKEALIISGSKHTSPAELYGHQVLSLREVDPNESENRYKTFLKTANDEMERWRKENPEAKDKEAEQQFDLIKSGLQERLAYEYRSGTVSDYFMGQVYQAMKEGRPIILDEVNAIPHDVLISLNHLLTRKVGDVIRIQQNSGSEVKIAEGFGFILTGNINEGGADRYVMRQDLDPAFLSRLHLMKHDYLPQVKVGTLDEASAGDGKGGRNELFELMTSRVMDKNGDIEIPEGELRKLWNLAKAARATEDNFSGGSVDKSQFFKQGGGTTSFEYRLKEGVLSIRGMDRIITAWQNDGYRNELDYYVFTEFVNQSTKLSDKAYLYQLFKDQYGFFQGAKWEQNPDYGSKGTVSAFKVSAPEIPAPKIEFNGPRQVVDTVFGKGPERTRWPDYRKKGAAPEAVSPEIAIAEKLQEFENFKNSIDQRLHVLNVEFARLGTDGVTGKGFEGKLKTLEKAYEQLGEVENIAKIFPTALDKAAQSGDFSHVGAIRDDIEDRLNKLELSLPKAEGISMKEAKEIMGANFYGPEEIKTALALEFKGEIPPITFSKEILERLRDTHQLILYSPDFYSDAIVGIPPNSHKLPVNGHNMYENLDKKKKDGTKLLYDNDWYKNEKFFTEERTELRWKLVSKDLIPNSTSKNYLEQTGILADYVVGLYGTEEMPKDVKEALGEWIALKNNKKEFKKLQDNTVSSDEAEWKSAADTLEKLKLTQMFRESFIEWFYRTALTERTTGERLLPNTYSWTKSRASSGDFVRAGDFYDGGGDVYRSRPRYSNSNLGCAFSAVKL